MVSSTTGLRVEFPKQKKQRKNFNIQSSYYYGAEASVSFFVYVTKKLKEKPTFTYKMVQGFPNWWARPHLRARGFSEWARDFLKM